MSTFLNVRTLISERMSIIYAVFQKNKLSGFPFERLHRKFMVPQHVELDKNGRHKLDDYSKFVPFVLDLTQRKEITHNYSKSNAVSNLE